MAKVKIQGHASGTGVLTVTAPNTSTDRTITLPDATGTLLTSDGDGSNLTGTADATKLPLAGGTLTGNLDVTMTSVGDGIDLIDTHTAHGITDYLPTNASLRLTEQNDTEGGGRIIGATDNAGQHGLSLYGLCQDSAVATVNNIMFVGAEKSGTSIAAVANDKSVFKFFNNSTALLDIKGDGRGLSQFTAHAWANINQTGTQAIRDSHNVSSISDQATGSTRVNYSNNIGNSSTDACVVAMGKAGGIIYHQAESAGYWQGEIRNDSGSSEDTGTLTVLAFGD